MAADRPLLRRPLAWGLIALWLLYAALYIARTAVTVDGTTYFVLLDDPMISMTFARTWAEGHGLVWYPGAPRVEGVTNPLWTAVMAGVHLLGLPDRLTSLPIQILGAALLLANFLVIGRLGRLATGDARVGLIAAILTAAYFPLNNWALQGMEVGAVTLCTSAAVLLALRTSDGRPPPVGLFAILAVALLLRQDAAITVGIVLLFLLATAPAYRWRVLAGGLAVGVVGLALPTAARAAYYGDWLPNTYYLKMTGVPTADRVAQGARRLGQFVAKACFLPLLLPLAAWVLPRRPFVLIVAVVLGQAAYSVYVGGDAWENWGGANRYLAPAVPLLMVCLAAGVVALTRKLGGPADPAAPVRATALTLAAVLLTNLFAGPASLSYLLLLRPPPHRAHLERCVRLAVAVRACTAPSARVAVATAGIIPYFARRPAIDLLGKCDARIAHGPVAAAVRPPSREIFWPGHMKWDLDYSVGKLQPDVVAQWFGRPDPERYMTLQSEPPGPPAWLSHYARVDTPQGVPLMVRRGSPHVHAPSAAAAGLTAPPPPAP